MFGFGFALVPLYNVFCQAFGFNGRNIEVENGTYQVREEVVRTLRDGVDKNRTITVQFLANENKDLPWEFRPLQREINVHPGEVKQVRFYARNLSDKTVVARAIPSMQPSVAIKYFTKVECFCFNNQIFKPGEAKEMPLIFVVDRKLPQGIDKLTQSYTFFDTQQGKSDSVAAAVKSLVHG